MEEKKKIRPKKVKCASCKKEHMNTDADVVKHSARYYCQNCYNAKMSQKEDWENFLQTVLDYLEIEAPTGLVIKQIKEYTSLYGYTYPAMQYTLWYCKEIEGMEFNPDYGISCVKFNFDKAKRFYEQQERIARSVEKKELKNKTVSVNMATVFEKRETKMVDIGSLL